MNIGARGDRPIREATSGRLEIRLFPANQLGSDTELLPQVRSGGVSSSTNRHRSLPPGAERGHREHRLRIRRLR
nr:hypothetical protein [Bradyrhizobium canariense]